MGFAVLACNSALAIRSSWGDAGAAIAFVLAAAAALLSISLREFERAGRGRDDMIGGGIAARYSALARMGLAALACDAALAVHDARPGAAAGSMACVLLAYAALLALTWLFLRSFDDGRARAARR